MMAILATIDDGMREAAIFTVDRLLEFEAALVEARLRAVLAELSVASRERSSGESAGTL